MQFKMALFQGMFLKFYNFFNENLKFNTINYLHNYVKL